MAPAPDHMITTGEGPGSLGRLLSVLVGRTYAIGRDGSADLCEGEFRLRSEPEYLEDLPYPGTIRPSLLRYDTDAFSFRHFTDLVVQGTVRTQGPVRAMHVNLACTGADIDIRYPLVVTGDRQVERGITGPQLSEPVPFDEMPLRYDKAYGGTDEIAEARGGVRAFRDVIIEAAGEGALHEMGTYSYPRNPAGKGFIVEPEGLIDLRWPNIELANAQLSATHLERLAQPLAHWGDRPYPAGFDWFSHDWFPRVAYCGLSPATHDGLMPQAEVQLGVLRADEAKYPVDDRIHRFAQGAHPFLCRHRLQGRERLTVTSLGPEGRDLVVNIPSHQPRVHLSLFGAAEREVGAVLDRVFVQADEGRLTLLWRASIAAGRENLPIGWAAKCPYRIDWDGQSSKRG